MHDSFAALLQNPTAQRYKRVRSQLLSTTSLGEFSLALAQLEESFTQGEFNTAVESVQALKLAGLLSMKYHRLAGMIAWESGDHARAGLHKFAYDSLRTAILATGSGTRKKPYFITYSSDAHELAAAGGFSVKSQSFVEEKEHRYDVLLCENEREFWFDITDLLPITSMAVSRRSRPTGKVVSPTRRKKAVSR